VRPDNDFDAQDVSRCDVGEEHGHAVHAFLARGQAHHLARRQDWSVWRGQFQRHVHVLAERKPGVGVEQYRLAADVAQARLDHLIPDAQARSTVDTLAWISAAIVVLQDAPCDKVALVLGAEHGPIYR
jgi:hypothetical protein